MSKRSKQKRVLANTAPTADASPIVEPVKHVPEFHVKFAKDERIEATPERLCICCNEVAPDGQFVGYASMCHWCVENCGDECLKEGGDHGA